MKTSHIISILALVSLAACGGKSGGGSSHSEGKEREMVEATPGTYYTVLRPVNFRSNGFIPYGQATFELQNDDLKVSISADDDQAVPHRQSLHMGTRCPTMADDTNADGFVDYNEAMAVVGQVILPLDGDLNSHAAGAGLYPRGGGMTYARTASLSQINSDLGAGIGFENRVVLVHGTSYQSSFPTSLASFEGEASHLSLPVLCGVLKKIR